MTGVHEHHIVICRYQGVLIGYYCQNCSYSRGILSAVDVEIIYLKTLLGLALQKEGDHAGSD